MRCRPHAPRAAAKGTPAPAPTGPTTAPAHSAMSMTVAEGGRDLRVPPGGNGARHVLAAGARRAGRPPPAPAGGWARSAVPRGRRGRRTRPGRRRRAPPRWRPRSRWRGRPAAGAGAAMSTSRGRAARARRRARRGGRTTARRRGRPRRRACGCGSASSRARRASSRPPSSSAAAGASGRAFAAQLDGDGRQGGEEDPAGRPRVGHPLTREGRREGEGERGGDAQHDGGDVRARLVAQALEQQRDLRRCFARGDQEGDRDVARPAPRARAGHARPEPTLAPCVSNSARSATGPSPRPSTA